MTDAHVWTALGIMASAFAALVTLTLVTIRSSLDGLRGEFRRALAEALGPVTERLSVLETKVDRIDADVTALTNRWGRGEMP